MKLANKENNRISKEGEIIGLSDIGESCLILTLIHFFTVRDKILFVQINNPRPYFLPSLVQKYNSGDRELNLLPSSGDK